MCSRWVQAWVIRQMRESHAQCVRVETSEPESHWLNTMHLGYHARCLCKHSQDVRRPGGQTSQIIVVWHKQRMMRDATLQLRNCQQARTRVVQFSTSWSQALFGLIQIPVMYSESEIDDAPSPKRAKTSTTTDSRTSGEKAKKRWYIQVKILACLVDEVALCCTSKLLFIYIPLQSLPKRYFCGNQKEKDVTQHMETAQHQRIIITSNQRSPRWRECCTSSTHSATYKCFRRASVQHAWWRKTRLNFIQAWR